MLCPNCHSQQIITVQDQQFCINCGQMVPPQKPEKHVPHLQVDQNGLPEGVKIIGEGANNLLSMQTDTDTSLQPRKVMDALEKPRARRANDIKSIHPARSRITDDDAIPNQDPDSSLGSSQHENSSVEARPPVKRRKPGRPKAGKLDVPKSSAQALNTAPTPIPQAPQVATPPSAKTTQHRTSARDDTNTQPESARIADATQTPASKGVDAISRPRPSAPPKSPHDHFHNVGVAPLHFGSVIAFVFRETIGHHHLLLASIVAALLGLLGGFGVWLYLDNALQNVATQFIQGSPKLALELACLAGLYYLGRSISQSAIIYGVSREADGRPVGLARQFGAGINIFTKRLKLDALNCLVSASLILAMVLLVITGGANWHIHDQLQLIAVFIGFLVLLYLLAASSITHGLATVAVVVTKQPTHESLSLGWRLFRHRFELIGIHVGMKSLELIIATPLLLAALGLVMVMPKEFSIFTAIGVGIIAWITGTLLGAGTATWWTALYRKIIALDYPNGSTALLSSRQPAEADRVGLTLVAILGGLLIASCALIPWLNLS